MNKKILFIVMTGLLYFSTILHPVEHSNLLQLKNGIEVIYTSSKSSENTALQLFISGGQRMDPPGKEGLVYLTSRIILEPQTLAQTQILNKTGTSFGLHAFEDYTVLTLEGLSKHFDESVKIFGSLISKPLLSANRLFYTKQYLEILQKNEEDNPDSYSLLTMKKLLFQTLYNRSMYGTRESLKKISAGDLQRLYKKAFKPVNLCFSISTDLPKEEVLALLNKHLNLPVLQTSDQPPDPPAPAISPENRSYKEQDSKQTTISLGFPIATNNWSAYLKTELLTNLLGKGIGSILWPLRSEYKLAYSISSNYLWFQKSAVLLVKLSTENEKRQEARDRMGELLNQILKGIDEKRLESVKNYSKLRYLKATETKSSLAYTAGFFKQFGFRINLIDQFDTQIDRITLEDFNRFIRETLKIDNRLEVVIGQPLHESPGL